MKYKAILVMIVAILLAGSASAQSTRWIQFFKTTKPTKCSAGTIMLTYDKTADQLLVSKDGCVTYQGVGVSFSSQKTLTESSATGLVAVALASNTTIAGSMAYSIEANDGTDYQIRAGSVYFAAVNKAGTITCATPTEIGTSLPAVSTGTLTVTWTCTTATDKITIAANAVSSLTQTLLRANYVIRTNKPANSTAQ